MQAAGRDINLFYLKDNIRERIEVTRNGFSISNTSLTFSLPEMQNEVENFPERFSPNVILRPVFQELVLPNIAFIGGGGELAYWLELGKVFEAVDVHFPMLVLRNSFMIINHHYATKINSLDLSAVDLFQSRDKLFNGLVKKKSGSVLQFNTEKLALQEIYDKIENDAAVIDPTLQKHVRALCARTLKRIESLENKMLKTEKMKYESLQRQLKKSNLSCFPVIRFRKGLIIFFLIMHNGDLVLSMYYSGLQKALNRNSVYLKNWKMVKRDKSKIV